MILKYKFVNTGKQVASKSASALITAALARPAKPNQKRVLIKKTARGPNAFLT